MNVAHCSSISIPKIFQSRLLAGAAISLVAVATLPFPVTATLAGALVVTRVARPDFIPGSLNYELGIADLVFHSTLTRFFPSCDRHWWHEITPDLILGGVPLKNFAHDAQLKKLGVRAVLTILEKWESRWETFASTPVLSADWKKRGIIRRRVSCPDMHPVSLKELNRSTRWIHQQISKGKKTYVHCKAGRGRSAMMVVAYLMRYRRLSLEEAISFVSSKRAVIGFRPAQYNRLKEFEDFYSLT